MIHIWRPWKFCNFQPSSPTPLSFYVQNSSTPLILDVQNQMNPPPLPHLPPSLQMITNQFIENIIQRWLSYVIRSFLQVGFRFQYQLINLVWLSFDFFSFSWSLTICFSVTLYSCMCSCSTKCITTKDTVISPDFLVWKFCGKAQFPHSFDRIAGNYTETVLFRKISTPGNQVKLQYFSQCILFIFIHIISTHFAINLFYLHNLNM